MQKFWLLILSPIYLWCQQPQQDVSLLIENKQYQDAQDLVEQQLQKTPNDLKSVELLGDIYAYQEQWDDAILQYKILVDASPELAQYHYKYGGAMAMKAASNKLAGIGLIDDIKEAFIEAANLDLQHVEVRWALVKFYTELPSILGGTMTNALFYAEELLELSPVDGHLAKGYIYKADDDFDQAESHYKKAVDIGGSKTCYLELAQLYMDDEQVSKAKQVLQEGYQKTHASELLQKLKSMD